MPIAPSETTALSSSLRQLRDRLRDMFQLDRGDLDFGIYRIMNFRREEILRFLEEELPARALAEVAKAGLADGAAALRKELDRVMANLREAGMDPDLAPRVRELRAEIARQSGRSPDRVLEQIWSALDLFFGRYYEEGDFVSRRRGKGGAYLIPYDGEEVKLHWANKDQYYVKSSEDFSNYVFRLDDGKGPAVRFRVVAAEGLADDTKEAKGKQRRFRLAEQDPVGVEGEDLVVRFTYQADDNDKRRQEALNEEAAARLLAMPAVADWVPGLCAPAPTDREPGRRLLDKHLSIFTAKNSFDYFIHKDLKGFLTRELETYLKLEVMDHGIVDAALLDGRPDDAAVEYAKARAIRAIAKLLIEFLAQIEEFQKRLWLKKKFVLETQWCITLDRIDPKFYPEIAANEAQRDEWVALFGIDGITAERLGDEAYSEPLSVDFLKANPFLVLDTRHFTEDFKARLLAAQPDLDDRMDGLLVHGDNFHGLRLLENSLRNRAGVRYIDPPYNTEGDDFIYKDNYKNSSWLSMIFDRLSAGSILMKPGAATVVSIDDAELDKLSILISEYFGDELAKLIWDRNRKNDARYFSVGHEYMLCFVESKSALGESGRKFRQPKDGIDDAKNVFKKLTQAHGDDWSAVREGWIKWFDDIPVSDPRRRMLRFSKVGPKGPFRDDGNPSWPGGGGPRYEILHPTTGKPCKIPSRGWVFPTAARFWEVYDEGRIAFGSDETTIPSIITYLFEGDGEVMPSVHYSYAQTASQKFDALFGRRVFENPKPWPDIQRMISYLSDPGDLVIDDFAGSGTTGHAVIEINRLEDKHYKYALIEMGRHFDDVLCNRLKKIIYSSSWKDGKPVSRDGISHAFKYIRLESYEDALDNLVLEERPKVLEDLFAADDAAAGPERMGDLRVKYMLSHMLRTEARGRSLLDLDAFARPFDYRITIHRDGRKIDRAVDLVETFNWLIGLRVQTLHAPRRYAMHPHRSEKHGRLVLTPGRKGRPAPDAWYPDPNGAHWFRVVEGTVRDGDRASGDRADGTPAVVIWRSLTGDAEVDNLALEAFLRSANLNLAERDNVTVWINGGHNVQNLRLAVPGADAGTDDDGAGDMDDTGPDGADTTALKIRLIEEDFHRLMFADTDSAGLA